ELVTFQLEGSRCGNLVFDGSLRQVLRQPGRLRVIVSVCAGLRNGDLVTQPQIDRMCVVRAMFCAHRDKARLRLGTNYKPTVVEGPVQFDVREYHTWPARLLDTLSGARRFCSQLVGLDCEELSILKGLLRECDETQVPLLFDDADPQHGFRRLVSARKI